MKTVEYETIFFFVKAAIHGSKFSRAVLLIGFSTSPCQIFVAPISAVGFRHGTEPLGLALYPGVCGLLNLQQMGALATREKRRNAGNKTTLTIPNH